MDMKDYGYDALEKQCTYANFVSAWYAFRERLVVDFEGGFVCDELECGMSPKIIVCDGTSLGFRRSMMMSALTSIVEPSELEIPIKRIRYCFTTNYKFSSKVDQRMRSEEYPNWLKVMYVKTKE